MLEILFQMLKCRYFGLGGQNDSVVRSTKNIRKVNRGVDVEHIRPYPIIGFQRINAVLGDDGIVEILKPDDGDFYHLK